MKVPINHVEVYKRIQEVTGVTTQDDIATILGIKQSSVSLAKKRQRIPSDWYLTLYVKLGVNPTWLMYGWEPRIILTEQGADKTINFPNEGRLFHSPLSIPVYKTVYSMFPKKDKDDEWPYKVEKIVIPKFFSGPHITVFCTTNNALAPYIYKDTYIGINTSQRYPVTGEFFAFKTEYEGIILGKIYYDHNLSSYIIKNNISIYLIKNEDIQEKILGLLVWAFQKYNNLNY